MSNIRLGSGVAAALLSLASVSAAAQTPPYWHHPYMMGDGGWLAMIFGPIFMLLPLAALIAVIVFAVRWGGDPRRTDHRPSERTPLDILKERFARGEIDKEEYEDRRRVLSE